MFCKNCGNQFASEEAIMCVNCGVQKGMGSNFCPNCGQPTQPGSVVCLNCGVSTVDFGAPVGDKSKMAAGLLGIFLGAFGVHNFYLGYTAKAVIQLVCTIVGLVLSCIGIGAFIVSGISIWAFVEAILILCGKIDKDGKGQLLKD